MKSELPKFRDRDSRGHSIGAQATKTDLVDIARAIGLNAHDKHTVPELRACIRHRFEVLYLAGKLP